VLCAQAFHWFRPAEAFSEFWRILGTEGRLVLMMNERDTTAAPTRAYNAAMRAATERELSEGMRGTIEEALRAASRTVTPGSFPYRQGLTREGLVGRARSASYVPKEGPRYERLLRDLDDLWVAHHDTEGLVALCYRTLVFRVERK
jgi:SAM-dependent methyltransferase